MTTTRVLSVASECAPLVKTGGLADVAGALPAALRGHDVDMRVLLPGYPAVMAALGGRATAVHDDPDLFGGPARVLEAEAEGLSLMVLDAPHLYDRPGNPYLGPDGQDWPDNPERFAALSWIAATLAANGTGRWAPHLLHLHDWQAGLAPVYLREMGMGDAVGTLLTIHNIAFGGLAPVTRMGGLRLPPALYHPDGYEFYGQIGALKAGLMLSDKLSTVSPTYARELTTPEFGMGLDGVLRARSADLAGILNGIDATVWDPANDPNIPHRYKTPRGKARSRAALIEEFGLDPEAPGPLCIVISRLTQQKGLDLLLDALPALLEGGGQLALLGSGQPDLESAYAAAARDPRVSVRIGYDEPLSHRMMAGGDAILVPSRFEPCGLTQLYGLRYGTLPVVTLTGGLADTVIPANAAALAMGVATGLQIAPITSDALATALARLCRLHADPPTWQRMARRAMAQPVDWGPSAAAYAALYSEILSTK